MPKITIDGTEIEVEMGTTVIQAAEQLGIDIPRYCYHPGLSIVGVCRICLVEIERMPKLQVACYTPVTDGMVVHTNNEKVLQCNAVILWAMNSSTPCARWTSKLRETNTSRSWGSPVPVSRR